MPIRSLWWKLGGAVVLGCVVLGGSAGQPPPKAPAAKEWPALQVKYFGAELGCGTNGCHSSPPFEKKNDPLVCRCTEYKLWSEPVKGDKHADAHAALETSQSKRMGELLGYKDVATEPKCLACHAAVVKPEERGEGFSEKDGVSCSVCHGAAANWHIEHGFPTRHKAWRLLKAEEKEKYGMTDLWNPVKRAALCASCHIGNKAQDKFVTHDMYAAGHPPLPGFEVAAFSDQMPRHWEYRREKPKAVQALLGYTGAEWEQTKLVVVGAVVNLRESMRLLAAQAAECQKAADPDNRALDLANFDCYACHHNLKADGARQQRGFAGKPGRVPMPAWPTTLVPLALRFLDRDDKDAGARAEGYAKLLKKVRDGFDARPYGSPADIAAAAKDLADWADDVAKKVDAKVCDAAAAKDLLAKVGELAATAVVDYDSARQVAWAHRTLLAERQAITGEPGDGLAGFDKLVNTTLPEGRGKGVLLKALPGRMELLNSFDPKKFKDAFRAPGTK